MSEEIFDRRARQARRTAVYKANSEDRWIIDRLARELLDRWLDKGVPAKRILIVGHDNDVIMREMKMRNIQAIRADGSCAPTVQSGGLQVLCEEDRLPFVDASFDAVFAVGTLDTVNDLPGALILIRRSLTAGGQFFGAFVGGGSLETLKAIAWAANDDAATVNRFHPQIDVRSAGDLLVRAGFSQSVSDGETLDVRYSKLEQLFSDLKVNGLTNCLANRYLLRRDQMAAWRMGFQRCKDVSGRVTEKIAFVFLSGEKP